MLTHESVPDGAQTQSPRASEEGLRNPPIYQVSPWYNRPTVLGFDLASTNVNVAAIGPSAYGIYSADMEYWYANGFGSFSSARPGATMTMAFVGGSASTAQITALLAVGGATSQIAVSENASGLWDVWGSPTYTVPTGATGYQFSAPDPDNGSHTIGILMVVSASGLQQIVWYKMCPTTSGGPTGGYVWQAAASPVAGLTWTYVTKFTAGNAAVPTGLGSPPSGYSWFYVA